MKKADPIGKLDSNKSWFKILKYVNKYIYVDDKSTVLSLHQYFCSIDKTSFKSLSRALDVRKNGPLKSRHQGVKMVPCVSWHMKNNVKVILFHIKSSCVQGFVFVQITFVKSVPQNYFLKTGKLVSKQQLPVYSAHVYAFLCNLIFKK